MSWLSLSAGTCLAYGSVHQSHWCIFTTNRNLQFEMHWRRKIYSLRTFNRDTAQLWLQRGCGTAQLWHSMAVKTALPLGSPEVRASWGQASLQQDSSAVLLVDFLCSTFCRSALPCTGLLHCAPGRHLWCFSRGNAVFGGKGKYPLRARGELTYKHKSSSLIPDCFLLMQIRTLNSHSSIAPRGTALWISKCIHWSVNKRIGM